jgi:hypothetical protein
MSELKEWKVRPSPRWVWRAALVGAFLSLWLPSTARACGVSGGGAVGVSSCGSAEHEDAPLRKWRLGVGYGFASTAIRFDNDLRFDQTRSSALATLDYAATRRWTFELGAGSLLFGHLEHDGIRYDFSPGVLALLGASWRVVDADGARPFVLLQDQLAFVAASTKEGGSDAAHVSYAALDERIGGLVGWTYQGVVSPYALARVFGGPVFWRYQGSRVTGGDTHHYQLGAGLVVLIAKRFDISVEGVPLGERALSGALGFAF